MVLDHSFSSGFSQNVFLLQSSEGLTQDVGPLLSAPTLLMTVGSSVFLAIGQSHPFFFSIKKNVSNMATGLV